MARSWDYSPRRRLLMQAALWIILAAAVGVASLVSQHKRESLRVTLGEPRVESGLAVRLPEKWKITSGGDAGIVLAAREAVSDPSARTLLVLRQRTGVLVPPSQYLLARGLAGVQDLATARRLPMAGWPGLMVSVSGHKARVNGVLEDVKHLVACVVLPSRQAIAIRLQGLGPLEQDDVEIVEQVARSLKVEGEATPGESGGELSLYWGGQLKVPPPWLIIRENDVNRVERQLLRLEGESGWMACELIPAVHFADEEPQTLLGLLAVRESGWARASVRPDGPHRWRIDLPGDGENSLFPVRAYAVGGEGGQALLAIFRGEMGAETAIDSAWQTLVSGLQLAQQTELGDYLVAGAEEARRLRSLGLKQLIPTREEEWWLWYNEGADHRIGWTRLRFDDDNSWLAMRETRWRNAERRLLQVDQTWRGTPDMSQYESVQRLAEGSDTDARGEQSMRLETKLADGRLTMTLRTGRGRSPSISGPVPHQFVPGGWLPLLIGQLQARPMILRTETFIGREGAMSMGLLTLVIEPFADAPRVEEGQQALRCVSVMVNGSGEVSRWYYRPDGTLASIDFAGGVRRVPSTLQELRLGFDADGGLRP